MGDSRWRALLREALDPLWGEVAPLISSMPVNRRAMQGQSPGDSAWRAFRRALGCARVARAAVLFIAHLDAEQQGRRLALQ